MNELLLNERWRRFLFLILWLLYNVDISSFLYFVCFSIWMKKEVRVKKRKHSSSKHSDDDDLVFRWKGKGVKKNRKPIVVIMN